MFSACSDDDDNDDDKLPVLNVTLPSTEIPAKPGATMTIDGEGFTAASEIWFRQVVTKAKGDVQAPVKKVTPKGITFVVPEVYGRQIVLLKENDKEYKLGEMSFIEKPEEVEELKILPRKIKEIRETREYKYGNNECYVYRFSYDEERRLSVMRSLTVSEYEEGEETYDSKMSVWEYSYKESRKIRCAYYELGYEQETPHYCILTLDDDGRVDSYGWEEEDEETRYICYDNGYLQEICWDGVEYGDKVYRYSYTENWSFVAGSLYQYKYFDDDDWRNVDYEPGNDLNNLNIDLLNIIFNNTESEMTSDFPQGIYGKRSRLLPQTVTVHYGDEEGEMFSYIERFSYEKNGDYIVKIIKEFEVSKNDYEKEIEYIGGYYEIFYYDEE